MRRQGCFRLIQILNSSKSCSCLTFRKFSICTNYHTPTTTPTRHSTPWPSDSSRWKNFNEKFWMIDRRINFGHDREKKSDENNVSEAESNSNGGGTWRPIGSTIAGLLLMFWAKSQWDVVEAAKPFGGGDSGGESPNIYRGRQEDGKGVTEVKRSNRERYNFISDVVDQVIDAVVSIEVKDHSHVNFFGGPQTSSNGSGFIVSEDGLILTNAHVVATKPRASLSVRLSDGRTFHGTVENIDYESDLATVRIRAKNLPTLTLGCSADTKIGEWVVAVGAPLTLSNSITAGVVSSVSRGASQLGIHANDINYIQTDAAITFGNSGGPLINLDAEVIGINSLKVAAGISFAIPIDHAKIFLQKTKTTKMEPSRRYLGITIITVTDTIRQELESRGYKKVSQGVLVWQIVTGSPAYLAGMKPGDIIVRANGIEIRSSAELYDIMRTADKLNIHVQRGENIYSCNVTPEKVEAD